MSEPMVKAEGVHKRFGRLEVLKGISLEVKRNVGATQTVPASLPTQPAAPAGAPTCRECVS